METFCNAQTFADNYNNNEKIPKRIIELSFFTINSKSRRNIISIMPFSHIISPKSICSQDYLFQYNGKTYPFSVFSDKDLQKYDKKVLESTIRLKEVTFRSLKLACSLDLLNPRIAIGNSIVGVLDTLIVFQENGIDKVIDYARNLIMSKNDYYEIFKFNELNVVDKFELYNIYCIMKKTNNYELLYEYLIFTKEIFNDLAKNECFKYLNEKYGSAGYNKRNDVLFGDYCDCLFFCNEDFNNENDDIIEELDAFTLNPTIKSKHIHYLENEKVYMLKAKKVGYFTFNLLSDYIPDEEIKEQLLSKNRYNHCHKNASKIARVLSNVDTYIVGGKIKDNEKDYYFHSWIELENDSIVIDFNHNIIMNREKYYELFGAVAISKTSVLEMEKIIQTVIFDAGLSLQPMDLNYFGTEFMQDLQRNEKVLKNK